MSLFLTLPEGSLGIFSSPWSLTGAINRQCGSHQSKVHRPRLIVSIVHVCRGMDDRLSRVVVNQTRISVGAEKLS